MNMADQAAAEGVATDGSSFFHIFLDDDRSHKTMRIPQVFWKKKMKGKKCEGDVVYLKLRGDDYNTWKVNLVKDESSSSSSSGSGGGLRFSGAGWSKFVNDNSICSGDFAIFKLYDDDVTFKVTVFDPSGCEKHLPPCNLLQETNIKSESSDEDDLQVAAAAPLHPFFTAVIKRYNIKDFLGIPMKFVKEYMKNLEERSRFIVSYQGKEWEVSVVRNKTNCYISKGWTVFVRDNQLNVGDTCNFYLHHSFTFRVTISRATATPN